MAVLKSKIAAERSSADAADPGAIAETRNWQTVLSRANAKPQWME